MKCFSKNMYRYIYQNNKNRSIYAALLEYDDIRKYRFHSYSVELLKDTMLSPK